MMSIDAWQGQKADKTLLGRCREAIRRAVPDAEIILYGSRARGDDNEYSDYDILVLVDQPASIALKDRILSCVYPLELETGGHADAGHLRPAPVGLPALPGDAFQEERRARRGARVKSPGRRLCRFRRVQGRRNPPVVG